MLTQNAQLQGLLQTLGLLRKRRLLRQHLVPKGSQGDSFPRAPNLPSQDSRRMTLDSVRLPLRMMAKSRVTSHLPQARLIHPKLLLLYLRLRPKTPKMISSNLLRPRLVFLNSLYLFLLHAIMFHRSFPGVPKKQGKLTATSPPMLP